MNKYSVTREDLIKHLGDQIAFIIASSISYDKEFEGEAKRLATTIRVLVHDTTVSSALLTQLNKKHILFYDSACTFDPNNALTSNCLTMVRLSKKEGEPNLAGDYVAPLENISPSRNNNRIIGFDRWWNRNIVFKDIKGSLFKRKDLVLTVANKEGGAHVDPELDQAYVNLTRFNSLAWKVFTLDERKDMGNPVPPAIRQIAHEVIKTLADGVIDLFPDKLGILPKFEEYKKHCLKLSIQQGFKQEASRGTTSG